jgi:hypothetical protein
MFIFFLTIWKHLLIEYIKKEKLIICRDWNINLLQENEQVKALENILVSYDLINTVTVPRRVTSSSESLIDVMVINRQFNKNYIEVVNMGFSYQLVQILWVYIDTCNIKLKKVLQRKFSKENVDKFTVMLNNELWEEIYVEKNVNELYQLFVNKFLYYFNGEAGIALSV